VETFEIKDRFTGEVKYSADSESLKIAVEQAIKERIDLANAYLDGANLKRANLAGANLNGANLDGANLEGAYLDGAYLDGANLKRANLNGANLDGANLKRANLDGAYLDGANLKRANLAGANLNGATLDGAYLANANLDGVIIRNDTIISLIPIQISGAHWDIIIWDEHMQIGCEFHSFDDWFSFDDRRILEMNGKTALIFWHEWKDPLQQICKQKKQRQK